jgi:hypothetical protein
VGTHSLVVVFALLGEVPAWAAGTPRLLATLHGTEPTEHLGWTMAAAGDVNGDGLADLIVGDAREGWYPGERRGYIYLGRASLANVPDLVIPQPEGEDDGRFAWFVSGDHDINGDGFDDVVITGPDSYGLGKMYLYYGGSPMGVEPDVAMAAWNSSWITDYWYTGLQGRLVGDVNNDGFDELACLVEALSTDCGAYVYHGGAPMDSVHDLAFHAWPQADLGSDLADGDVNGDGWVDVVVGGYGPDAAWVYLGGAEMDTVPDVRLRATGMSWPYHACIPGDLNGDGFEDVVASHHSWYARGFVFLGGTPMDSIPDLEFCGVARSGGSFSLAGGDLNRDGFADFLVGDNSHDYPDTARFAIYLGGAELDTVPDFEILATNSFGYAVAFLGDMTGDGWPEFAVSDPHGWSGDYVGEDDGPGVIYIYTYGEEAAGGDPTEARPIPTLRIIPNPTRGPVSIWWNAADVTGSPELAVYDMAGYVVRRLLPPRASQLMCWDLTSASGSRVSPGTYVIRLRSGQTTAQPGAAGAQSARLVVTR